MIALILVILMGAVAAVAIVIAWRAVAQLEEVTEGRHARTRAREDAAPPRPATSLVTPAEAEAEAEAEAGDGDGGNFYDDKRHPATEPGGVPVLGDRTISEVRAEMTARREIRHADLMHAGYASAVDRLRREAGLPTVEQMQAMRAGSPAWLFPPLTEPGSAEPEPRGPVHDTRLDYAFRCVPDVAPGFACCEHCEGGECEPGAHKLPCGEGCNGPAPAYGQAPQLVVAPELARRVIA